MKDSDPQPNPAQNRVYVNWGEFTTNPVPQMKADAQRATTSGNSLSVIFDELKIDLVGTDKVMQKSLLTTFSIPVTVPQTHELVRFSTELRFFVSKNKGTRISICINLPGTTKLITFPAENAIEGKDPIRTIREKIVSIPGQPVRTTDYTAHVFICMERCHTDSEAAVHIDSFDVAAELRRSKSAK